MKNIGILFVAIHCFAVASSQTVMNHNKHALKSGEHNPMTYCSYLEPGLPGTNVIWDFSELRFEKSFQGFIRGIEHSDYGKMFPETNTELAEFNSRFYFKVSEDKMEQYGYSSEDGKTLIHYSTPFVKLKFPFAYNDAFSGIFAGTIKFNGSLNGTVTGSYYVEADAYGTLILPGNTIYENTLRIRTEKKYVHQYTNLDQEVLVVTYRWYNTTHRYPLLVLTLYTTKTKHSENTKYQAAYNVNALTGAERLYAEDIELYPNPTTQDLNIRVNTLSEGRFQFNIFDSSGKLVRSFFRETSAVGLHDFNVSDEISGLRPAAYMLVILNKGTQISKGFVLSE